MFSSSNYMSVKDQIFFMYFNQNNTLQEFESRSRYENPAVFY